MCCVCNYYILSIFRTSIFDDNIHKYGELTIKYKNNGDLKQLSKLLIKSNFAQFDICDFYQQLSSGNLKTKLSITETQNVLEEIKKYYSTKASLKRKYVESLEKRTTVVRLSQDMETALTVSNLEKHNNRTLYKMFENKMKDLELCKDIEEEALGRGYVKSKEPSIIDQSDSDTNKSQNDDEAFSRRLPEIKNISGNDTSNSNEQAIHIKKETTTEEKKVHNSSLCKKLRIYDKVDRDKMIKIQNKLKFDVEKQNVNEECTNVKPSKQETKINKRASSNTGKLSVYTLDK